MKVGALRKKIESCRDNSEIIIFVTTEQGMYRPFRNIGLDIFNKNSMLEEIHLDVSINKEYKSIHFPNNLTKEQVLDLKERREMLLEDLEDIEKQLGEHLW